MADQITTAFVRQFSDNFKLTAQQLETALRAIVTVETNIKDKKYIDYVGVTGEPEAQTALVQDANLQEVPHSRRLVVTLPYVKTVPIPLMAELRTLADPTNSYQVSIKAAFERFMEKKLFLAAIGNSISVSTAELTEQVIALPSTQKVEETGTLGMTAGKIIASLTRFNLNNRDKSEKFLRLSPLAIEDLMLDLDVTYPQQQALDMIRTGKLASLWGYNVEMSTQLPKTGNIRSAVAWCKEGLALGFNQDFSAEIQPRYDKVNLRQIAATIDFGCTRLQETDVFEIQHYESY
jgi:hypothetical protein